MKDLVALDVPIDVMIYMEGMAYKDSCRDFQFIVEIPLLLYTEICKTKKHILLAFLSVVGILFWTFLKHPNILKSIFL